VEAHDHVQGAADDPKEQGDGKRRHRARRTSLWTTGNYCGAAAIRATTFSTSAMKRSASSALRAAYQSRASISSARAAGLKTTDGTSAPLSELGAKLIPRNALFPVPLEPGDPPVEFGSLRLGYRNVLVVEALPKGLDQIGLWRGESRASSGIKSLMP
jgi:hypothetical protein